MVYLALGIVAVSISFYIISYGRPTRLRLSAKNTPREIPKTHNIGVEQVPEVKNKRKEDFIKADDQLKSELQESQEAIEESRSDSPQTTPKATPDAAESAAPQRPIPSFTLDGADDGLSKPAGRLRIDRDPISSSPRSTEPILSRQNMGSQISAMPPPPRPSPTARWKPDPSSLRPSSSLMPPPSSVRPNRQPLSTLAPPPSAASKLRQPPSRSLAPTSSSLPASSRPSKKILLSPGHSPLDWAALVAHPPSANYLRGIHLPPHLIKVPPSLLRHFDGRKDKTTGEMKDAWGVWAGGVYNLTPYLDFHPGGRGELLRAAGMAEDVTRRLFEEAHPWVSWEGMLGSCLVGILVSEGDGEGQGGAGGDMDEMD